MRRGRLRRGGNQLLAEAAVGFALLTRAAPRRETTKRCLMALWCKTRTKVVEEVIEVLEAGV